MTRGCSILPDLDGCFWTLLVHCEQFLFHSSLKVTQRFPPIRLTSKSRTKKCTQFACEDKLFILSRQVMYRGTSSSTIQSGMISPSSAVSSLHGSRHRHIVLGRDESHGGNGDDIDAKSVLSMKKSAEIAAVFSGAKITQMTDIVDHREHRHQASHRPPHLHHRRHNHRHSHEHPLSSDNLSDGDNDADNDNDSTEDAYLSKRQNCSCGGGFGKGKFSKANMQTSLGYFP